MCNNASAFIASKSWQRRRCETVLYNKEENEYSEFMTRSELQEKLVALYLRLNGYFTTGLIIHSADDYNVDGEVDVIGVRFGNHRQEDRLISCSAYLEIPEDSTVDVIIGEVKGRNSSLQFNESIRLYEDRRYKMLTWLGFLNDIDIDKVSKQLEASIQTKEINNSENYERINYEGNVGLISIRPILFAPDRIQPRANQIKFVHGQELLNFIWECFRPENRREMCETNYWAINNWGRRFEDLVRYFKQPNKIEVGNMNELYTHFGINE